MRRGLARARLPHRRGRLVSDRVSVVSAADAVMATAATLSRSHASGPAHRPTSCAVKLSWCRRVKSVVMEGQPQVVVAVIAGLLPHAHLARPPGIPKSNAMVTERYITCITVSRHEPYGQVSGQAGTSSSG